MTTKALIIKNTLRALVILYLFVCVYGAIRAHELSLGTLCACVLIGVLFADFIQAIIDWARARSLALSKQLATRRIMSLFDVLPLGSYNLLKTREVVTEVIDAIPGHK